MGKIPLNSCNLDLSNFSSIIGLCTFGSYNEDCFYEGKSDIDVMILLNEKLEWEEEFEIEDFLQENLKDHFNYENIHYTFIHEFVYPFSEIFIESKDKIIILEEKYLDYILGYCCFKRDRENLEIIRNLNLKEQEKYKNGLL